MAVIEDEVMQDLVRQLASQDAVLQATDRSYQLAKASREMATAQYAAIRDLVTRRLGYSPYSVNGPLALKTERGPNEVVGFPTKGRFRFANMAPGDAAVAALAEVDGPMGLDELVDRLKAGGITGSRESLTRAVNAALMRKSGIGKTDDGKYFRESPPPAAIRNLVPRIAEEDEEED